MGQIEKIFILDRKEKNPYENLALEEAILHSIPQDCYILYLWQNENTIVAGRNQNIFAQCNVRLAGEEEVRIARRLSGGGTVFHDLGNLNYTFFSRAPYFSRTLNTNIIVSALASCGVMAQVSGRNDILVKNKKVSGNAYYNLGDRYYHHGTLLINSDLDRMGRLLRVDAEKWKEWGIDSVRSRVSNLKDSCPQINLEDVKKSLTESFINRFPHAELVMAQAVLKTNFFGNIFLYEELVNKYASREWIWGRDICADYKMGRRFSWGDAVLCLEVEGAKVKNIELESDALESEFILKIKEELTGSGFSRQSMTECLGNLKKKMLSERENEILNDIIELIVTSEIP